MIFYRESESAIRFEIRFCTQDSFWFHQDTFCFEYLAIDFQRTLNRKVFDFFQVLNDFLSRFWDNHSIRNWILYPGQFFFTPGHFLFRIFGGRLPKNYQQRGIWFFSDPKWFFLEKQRTLLDRARGVIFGTVVDSVRTGHISNIRPKYGIYD